MNWETVFWTGLGLIVVAAALIIHADREPHWRQNQHALGMWTLILGAALVVGGLAMGVVP